MSPDELRRMFPNERKRKRLGLRREVKEPTDSEVLVSVVVVGSLLFAIIALALAMVREPSTPRTPPTPQPPTIPSR